MSRAILGVKHVADPLTETYRALYAAVEQKAWSEFNHEPVSYYHDRMICNWLLQLIDNALSDAQLQGVQPAQVHLIVLLLFRDMFRHHSGLLRPPAGGTDWIEPLWFSANLVETALLRFPEMANFNKFRLRPSFDSTRIAENRN